nr:hypothetical protein [uncultured bacterium]
MSLGKSLLNRSKDLLSGVVLISALAVQPFVFGASQTSIERGRIVYTSEGCAQCHSDEHRKGPDLSEVGNRRSELWLRMHLYSPDEVSGSSIMPSYANLFRTEKGNDLVAYLATLRATGRQLSGSDEQAWHLSAETIAAGRAAQGQALYNRYCSTCHSANGRTRLRWQSEFIESPAVFRAGVMQSQPTATDHVARIIKFGIPDSDMAGHENMPDTDIASLLAWLMEKPALRHPIDP